MPRKTNVWTIAEKQEYTKGVIPKFRQLGLGRYTNELKVLELILDNYIYRGVECETKIPLPGTKRIIVIQLKSDRTKPPLIKLSNKDS